MAILDEASDKAPSTTSQMPENGSLPLNATEEHGGYFWGIARFKVGKTRFQLPLYRFVEESMFFASHYGLIDAPSKNGVMNSFVTLDVELEDFERFLSAFLPRYPHSQVTLTKPEWISVLRLSTKWQFNDLRRTAIDRLDAYEDLTTMERTALAKELLIPRWLLWAYEEFVVDIERNTEQGSGRQWTNAEAVVVGWNVIVELQRIVIFRQHRTIQGNANVGVSSDVIGSELLSNEYTKMVEEARIYLTAKEIEEERVNKEQEEEEEEQRQRVIEEEQRRRQAEVEALAKEQYEREQEEAKTRELERLAKEREERCKLLETQREAEWKRAREVEEAQARRLEESRTARRQEQAAVDSPVSVPAPRIEPVSLGMPESCFGTAPSPWPETPIASKPPPEVQGHLGAWFGTAPSGPETPVPSTVSEGAPAPSPELGVPVPLKPSPEWGAPVQKKKKTKKSRVVPAIVEDAPRAPTPTLTESPFAPTETHPVRAPPSWFS